MDKTDRIFETNQVEVRRGGRPGGGRGTHVVNREGGGRGGRDLEDDLDLDQGRDARTPAGRRRRLRAACGRDQRGPKETGQRGCVQRVVGWGGERHCFEIVDDV